MERQKGQPGHKLFFEVFGPATPCPGDGEDIQELSKNELESDGVEGNNSNNMFFLGTFWIILDHFGTETN